MIAFPNAKINIGLYVTRKRSDGYHDLETVFFPVYAIRDALEVVPSGSGETQLHISGLSVAGDLTSNLVWKGWQLLKEKFRDRIPGLDIYLNKAIPMGAGLGGGSADGAFLLQLLNDYCALGLTRAELCDVALQLGSDCPFFVYNTPQFAQGRGELMTPLQLDLSAYTIEVVHPEVHIATSKAFSMITPKAAPVDLRNLADIPVNEWKELISNDFEYPIFHHYPELRKVKADLYERGAVYASMSGSGSAFFGLFRK